MRLNILVFFIFFIANNAGAVTVTANEIHLLGSFVDGKQVHYIVKKDELADVPEWSGVGEPPLSNGAATDLALKKYQKIFGKDGAKIRKIKISSKTTNCTKEQTCPTTLWYYKVKVKGAQRASYVILMNGQFVDHQ